MQAWHATAAADASHSWPAVEGLNVPYARLLCWDILVSLGDSVWLAAQLLEVLYSPGSLLPRVVISAQALAADRDVR